MYIILFINKLSVSAAPFFIMSKFDCGIWRFQLKYFNAKFALLE
jgi:hypothetical protein